MLLWALLLFHAGARERVLVLTDISNEPDDEQSLVRFLVYANEYDIEGLIATTSQHLRKKPREDLIRRQIAAYSKVKDNLSAHADHYPDAGQLLKVTATGQPGYGMQAVGEGKQSPGSRLLLETANRDLEKPLWVSVWGGANTLAQALFDARKERSAEETKKLVSRLRVYTISDQDDAGRWLRREFPGLFYIVSPSSSWKEYFRATWTGISGDRHYRNAPMIDFELVDNPWLEQHIISNHGPLGALYPRLTYIMEGDTPSFLGLVNNGLGWAQSPGYGGWGGRYALFRSYAESRVIWTNNHDSRDTIEVDGKDHTSDQATIWRWRRDFQHDFAARMDWSITTDYRKANHNPLAILNGDRSKNILRIEAKTGDKVRLTSAQSSDPDGNAITSHWMIYKEAGSYRKPATLSRASGEETLLEIPTGNPSTSPADIHVILSIRDNGTPSLVSYRRAVINVNR
ncbi:MAG: DUF1593 domain-containing protein [Verrucomicrobiaceae bacterium]|nr:DUF1593 domain-containing protein [Verrucomicrobiaceae bacterium]